VFCAIPADADQDAISASIHQRVAEVQRYVPGYSLRAEPQFDEARESWQGNARVAVFLQVRGAGDYLPEYAGNLDIMTAAAARVGELLAQGKAAEAVRA
jgi:acetaldehyde dehydrogenase